MVLRVGGALREAAARLHDARGVADAGEARAAAEALLGHVLGVERSWLFAHADDVLEVLASQRFEALLARRLAGEPVAYLVGRRAFWRFDLEVTPDTLIPRADTERLVEIALEHLPGHRACRVLDLGTGTGAIALAIAVERPAARVVAVDRSPGAAAVARRNARALGLDDRVEVREGDWFTPVAGERFDLVASNPPYIEDADPHLGEGDLRFEPRGALAAGVDGLDELRAIVAQAPRHLLPGGWLLLEHGWRQGSAVRTLLRDAGFGNVRTALDLESRERVTLGRLAAPDFRNEPPR